MDSTVKGLEIHVFLQSLGIFTTLMILLLVNIYIAVCRKNTWFSRGVHLTSFFIGLFLFCLFMQGVILDLAFEAVYEKIGWVSLLLGTLAGLSTWSYLIYCKGKSWESNYVNPDVSAVLSAIDDMVVICDYAGNVIEIKKDKKAKIPLKKEYHSLEELAKDIVLMFPGEDPKEIQGHLKNYSVPSTFEIGLAEENKGWVVTLSPVMAGPWNCMGAVLLFHDISKEIQLMDKINQKIQGLEESKEMLTHAVEVSSVLEAEKERQRIISGIQTQVMARMEDIVGHIGEIQKDQGIQFFEYKKKLEKISDELREVMQLIRISVRKITQ